MKYEDLKPGMIIKGSYLVMAVCPEDPTGTHEGKPTLELIELNDPYWGRCIRSVKDGEEFELCRYTEGTEEYKDILQMMIESRFDFIHHAMDDINLMRAFKRIKE